jgi:tellurite resistance protein TerA
VSIDNPTPSAVLLTPQAPAVSLTRQGAAQGTLRVHLSWLAGRRRGTGLLARLRRRRPISLELGCLYEYTDGSKGVVQALGDCFDDLHTFGEQPICWLDGHGRSGPSSGGENLFVDLEYRQVIRRLLIFAFVYDGVPRWAAAKGIVTVYPVAGPRIEVALDEPDPTSPLVAVAMVDNTGTELCVRREVRYVRGGQQLLDELYGWGMQWRQADGA